jgi:hypothetical protein
VWGANDRVVIPPPHLWYAPFFLRFDYENRTNVSIRGCVCSRHDLHAKPPRVSILIQKALQFFF